MAQYEVSGTYRAATQAHPLKRRAIWIIRGYIKRLENEGPSKGNTIEDCEKDLHLPNAQEILKIIEKTGDDIYENVSQDLAMQRRRLFHTPQTYEEDMELLIRLLRDNPIVLTSSADILNFEKK